MVNFKALLCEKRLRLGFETVSVRVSQQSHSVTCYRLRRWSSHDMGIGLERGRFIVYDGVCSAKPSTSELFVPSTCGYIGLMRASVVLSDPPSR